MKKRFLSITIALLVMGVIAIFTIAIIPREDESATKTHHYSYRGNNNSEKEKTSSQSNNYYTEPPTEEPTDPPTEEPTVDPAIVEKTYKEMCEKIDYKTLARNPNKYKDKRYVFTGEVIQVLEEEHDNERLITLRMNVTYKSYEYLDEGYYEDTILVYLKTSLDADRILEKDILTVWGVCTGKYTYTSVFGSEVTLPSMVGVYHEIKG